MEYHTLSESGDKCLILYFLFEFNFQIDVVLLDVLFVDIYLPASCTCTFFVTVSMFVNLFENAALLGSRSYEPSVSECLCE